MAVVKADSYGHGMVACAKALSSLKKNKPEYYAVAFTEEAIELRNSGIEEPILVLASFNIKYIDIYITNNIIPTLSSFFHLEELRKYKGTKKLKIHVNIDTGMGRTGVYFEDALNFFLLLSELNLIEIDGIYTHFSTSDENENEYAALQSERFRKVLNQIREKNINYGLVHTANSGAILNMKNIFYDMVRPGISLYGYYPSLNIKKEIQLRPVMSLVSKVTEIHNLNKGESVSYGRKYICDKETVVASVPIGYADGFYRGLTNLTKAIIGGKYFPQIGRVTMDRVLYDVTGANIKIGDEVILIGEKNDSKISAWDWAEKIDTIPYEITCNISKRVPRIYKNR